MQIVCFVRMATFIQEKNELRRQGKFDPSNMTYKCSMTLCKFSDHKPCIPGEFVRIVFLFVKVGNLVKFFMNPRVMSDVFEQKKLNKVIPIKPVRHNTWNLLL